MIKRLLIIILILLLLCSVLSLYSKREGLDQVIQNQNDLKKLNDDYNQNLTIKQEATNLEDMESKLQKNIKKLLNRINSMTYSTMNTSPKDVPQPPPQAPDWMFD